MINGIHALIYAKDADKTRSFFRDILKFRTVDVGHGWLIFALPPAELGIHPTDGGVSHELYLMCDDMASTLKELDRKNVQYTQPQDVGWGVLTTIEVPGGGSLGLYQPKHRTAIVLDIPVQRRRTDARNPRKMLKIKGKAIPRKRKSPNKRK